MLANPTNLWFIYTYLDAVNGYGYGTNMSPPDHRIPLVESQRHVINLTNPRRTRDDRVEDRLDIRR